MCGMMGYTRNFLYFLRALCFGTHHALKMMEKKYSFIRDALISMGTAHDGNGKVGGGKEGRSVTVLFSCYDIHCGIHFDLCSFIITRV